MVIVLVSLMYAPIQIESKTSLPIPEETVVIKTYCSVDRVLRMLGYDCSNMNLKEIPQNAKSSVEVREIWWFGSLFSDIRHHFSTIFHYFWSFLAIFGYFSPFLIISRHFSSFFVAIFTISDHNFSFSFFVIISKNIRSFRSLFQ